MGVKFTLATFPTTTALIGVKMATDNSIKASNMLSNPKGSAKVGRSLGRMVSYIYI